MRTYAEVVAGFQAAGVRFLVGGGVAGALYGVPRATFDLDLLVPPDETNYERALAALRGMGFVEVHDPERADQREESFIAMLEVFSAQEGLARRSVRVRQGLDVDLLVTDTTAVFDFYEASRKQVSVDTVPLPLLSLLDLLRLKEASTRDKDREDARWLRYILGKRERG